MSLEFLTPALYGLLAPLFLLRRPLTGDGRRSVRTAVGLWVAGVAGCTAFLVFNRQQLRWPVVLFGERVWLLWAGVGALVAAGLCLESGERSRRREKERRLLRERDGLPPPLDEESPEEEGRRLLAEIDRLEREQKRSEPGAAPDRRGV